MPTLRQHSQLMALCGVLAALALVFLGMGSLLPAATFCCPILAMLCMLPVVEEYKARTALLFYAAAALLALFLVADKEVALLYAFLGWYPAARPGLNRRIGSKVLNLLVKLLLFAVAVGAMYALAIPMLGMTYLAAEYAAGGTVLLVIMVAMGCVIWLLFDRVLARFTILYHKKWRQKLLRH